MYTHILYKLCIFLLIFQNVVSFTIYELDSEEGNKVLPTIRKLILNQRYHLNLQENLENVQRGGSQKPFGKTAFVKRIIPHGYTTGEFEYDPKLKTVFKPLVRYHVSKPLEDQEKTGFDRIREQPTKDKELIVLVQKDGQQDFLDQVKKVAELQNRLNKNEKFRGLLSRLDEEDLMQLRQSYVKSGEHHDPHAPGATTQEESSESESDQTTEKITLPSYPFWNYWTYEKTIQQDQCPGGLIKVANMCLSPIGHRSADPPNLLNTRRSGPHKKRRRSIRAARKKHLYGKK